MDNTNDQTVRPPAPPEPVRLLNQTMFSGSIPVWKQQGELTKVLDPKIRKFETGKSHEFQKWLKTFSKIIHRMHIPREVGTQLLPFYLTGEALEKYNSIEEKSLEDWEKVTKKLMRLHHCPQEHQLCLQELAMLEQGSKSTTAFGEHIRTLGDFVYHDMPENQKDKLLTTHFFNGCKPAIKRRLRLLQNMPTTLNGIMAEAEKAARIIEMEEKEDSLVAAVQQLQLQQKESGNGYRGKNRRGGFKGNTRGGFNGGNKDQSQNNGNQNWNNQNQGNWNNSDQGNQGNQNGYRGRGRGRRGNWNNRGNGNHQYQGNGNNQQQGNWNNQPQGNWNNQPQGNWNNQAQGNWNNQAQGNWNNQGQGPSNQPSAPPADPRIGWNTETGRPYVINSLSKFVLGIMTCILLIAPSSCTMQICGFGETGNLFIPPKPTPCNFDRTLPLQTYAVNVYRQRKAAIQMEAHKCFKHEVEGEVFSVLWIYRSTEAKIGSKQPITPEECRNIAITKKYNGGEMKEIAPGIFQSERIGDAAKNATPILGKSPFKTYEMTLEVGKVATLDGEHIISSLGSLEKCTFGSGVCQESSYTVVWQPQDSRRECQFEIIQSSTAIISQHHVAIKDLSIFSKFDTDLRRLQDALEGCNIQQGYRTDDGYLIEFPEVRNKGWVPDMHIEAIVPERTKSGWIRRTRETLQLMGPAQTTFAVEIGETFITPIIRRLYGSTNIEQLKELSNPITEPEILKELARFNVTKRLIADRSRLYPADQKHARPRLLMALKAIRTAQYGARQLRIINSLSRPLTRGEEELKIAIERQSAHTFDKLLEKEFGRSDIDARNINASYPLSYFEEESLNPYKNQPYVEEPSWAATTTTTPLPTTTTTFRTWPAIQPTSPTFQTTTRPTYTTRPTATTRPQPSPVKEMGYVPVGNRNLVYETTTLPRTESHPEYEDFTASEKSTLDTFEMICQDQWRETSLFQTLLRIDPTAAVRQLLRRKDISAKAIGETLLISQCRTVTPDVVHYGRKVNSTCYNLVPVSIKGTLWFQLPGSDDLISEAAEVDCGERPTSIRFEHNRWVSPNNHEVLPQFLARPTWQKQEQFILPPPETFHTHLDEEAGVMTGRDREIQHMQELQNNQLRSRLIRDGIIHDTIDAVKEQASKVGNSAKKLYKYGMDTMKEQAKDVVFSIIMMIVWIVVPFTVVGIIVVGLYGYCKWRIAKKAGNTARQAAKQATDELWKYARQKWINNVEMEMQTFGQPLTTRCDEEYPICSINDINAIRINYVAAARLPHIEVKIGDSTLDALFDTGAAISYMPLSSVTGKIDTDDQPQAKTANGSAFKFLGTCQTTVKIGDFMVPHKMLVSRDGDCPAPALIGSDIVGKLNKIGHDLSINLHKRELTIGGSRIKINAISGEYAPPTQVQLAETVSIQPRHEVVVAAVLEGYQPEMGTEFVIEDNQQDSDQIYMVARSLTKTDEKGKTPIQIFNPSKTKVHLRKGARVATAEKIVEVRTVDDFFAPPKPHPQKNWKDNVDMSAKVQEMRSMNDFFVSPEAHWESELPKLPQPKPPDYKVSDKIDIAAADLTDEQKEDLKMIINFHEKAFVGPDGRLGQYNGPIKHKIELVDERQIPQARIHRIPLEKRKEVETQISEMLKQEIIRPTESPFAAPIVLVRKADKTSWRFTVDFRALNAMTTPVQSVIPNIHEILDLCAGKAFYTTLDFQQGFHQIPVEPAHCPRTAFACHMGAFEYIRMPMGLKGSPGTFQRVMNSLIKEIRARIFVYIDDMVITSEDAIQHLKDIEEVLDQIEKSGMKLRPEKCKFALPEIIYLGFIISKAGIRPNPEKTRAIDEYPTPRTVKEVRAFIGMCSFYRRFIANFSKIAAPIMDLTKKEKVFEWTKECQEAMEILKEALTKNPILVAPQLGKPFIIEVDSSGRGVGAVLFQAQDDEGKDKRVIAYASRVYTGAEKRYPAIELEALGLTYAVKQFRPYIDGAKTLIITDHSPLKSLLYRKDLMGRMGKYQIVLQEYDIKIEYRPGKQNIVCDTLSRYHPRSEESDLMAINAIMDAVSIDFSMIEEEQSKDKKIQDTKNLVDKYRIEKNVLFERGPEDQWVIRLPTESSFGKKLTWQIHSSIFESAHLGRSRTEKRVRDIATWPGMSTDIRRIVERCTECQKNKDNAHTRIQAPLKEFPETTAPFQRVHSDFIGPLPETIKGNRYVAVFVDAFSKFIIAEAVPDQKADTLSEIFRDRVVARFGPPKLLVTDQGTNFMSQKFKELLQSLNCQHNQSTAYHHEANGQVERANQTLETMIRQMKDSENWDKELQTIIHAYNSSKNATTEVEPFKVIHGHQARSPLKNSLPEQTLAETPLKHMQRMEGKMPKINKECEEKIRKKTEKQRELHDRKKTIKDVEIKIGDQVLIRKHPRSKISSQFIGPFKVIDVKDPNITVEIPAIGTRSAQTRVKTMHKNLCKLAKEPSPEEKRSPKATGKASAERK
ncbi:hypothetical protein CAEBREN_19301 [Caenorhabditis brenneri]|uniref:RNA-directed DNA polymerase n=1 Tax=Caenorhabditis brenneri TaxID=135651 RepID=G0NEF9_CAEBE|nr:hypothetical protein CAEBREN_19301 [Caenorhabditis brenneri]